MARPVWIPTRIRSLHLGRNEAQRCSCPLGYLLTLHPSSPFLQQLCTERSGCQWALISFLEVYQSHILISTAISLSSFPRLVGTGPEQQRENGRALLSLMNSSRRGGLSASSLGSPRTGTWLTGEWVNGWTNG